LAGCPNIMLSVLRSTVVHYARALSRSGARQGHISHVQALKGVSLQDLMFTTTCSSDNRQGGTNIQPLPSPRGPLFPLSSTDPCGGMLSGEPAQSHFRANERRAKSVARHREMTL